mmetsp:Transcript_25433/g.55213  ORF Transcript_25433/g.55213 Transcript_25433/m.55213 type:complete len:677 (-) Transcript_25433:1350-3380(-)|eukprot:CAMPEP_0202889550 /NCGR_PEP_ID=MMETSP1392-20130828/133_1 /ASSEMBLY_ACC=CAM_ASM_000868 /TAXON_ID=225041 /ORGANISM="Chlamydomonas chlamydogama, Strain SAG 11-48b" /LENGTH=676 /DNA_ID=CAMNT_0049572905 /DNA_START=142 /DNA_END=2172 /DNA_ORIENTATION=+
MPEVAQTRSAKENFSQDNVVQDLKSTAGLNVPDNCADKKRSVQGAAEEQQPVAPRVIPSEQALMTWRTADCVCFDVDCTVTVNDSLDLLGEFMGCKEEVEELTNQAMDGAMNLGQSLEERLKIINCTPADIRRFIAAHPPEKRLTPGIERLVKMLKKRGVAVYLISGGFRELILPIAKHLGIPKDHVYANRMNWQWDDETGAPTRLVGFDDAQPTAYNHGKVRAIATIRSLHPYNNVVMIGDGITDLEAVQSSEGADLFIGYGGVIERRAVAEQAEWFVYDHGSLAQALRQYRVAVVGSGSFACAMTHIISHNVTEGDQMDQFNSSVRMWVHNDKATFEGRLLLDIINTEHVNPKYLPGVSLGSNVVASGDLGEVVRDADIIVLCVPHQYVHTVVRKMAGQVKRDAQVVSLTKGMRVMREGPQLISQMVKKQLGVDCSVLMGGNLAAEIGKHDLSEAVIGYTGSSEGAALLRQLFNCPFFNVSLVQDAAGTEMCGTLKNIVALGVGLVEGLGCGINTTAAIMRQGLCEMRKLSKALYPSVRDDTFMEACGLGDLLASCMGGRNRRVAEAFAQAWKAGSPVSMMQLEAQMLGGQKLQGLGTSEEVQQVLRMKGWEDGYPLFTTINKIFAGSLPPSAILSYMSNTPALSTSEEEEDVAPSRSKGATLRPAAPASTYTK